MKYRKKPVVIDAVQLMWQTWSGVCELIGEFSDGIHGVTVSADGEVSESGVATVKHPEIGLLIPTLEGVMLARENDFVIRGVQGELYPCKPDIFAATYELVDGDPS